VLSVTSAQEASEADEDQIDILAAILAEFKFDLAVLGVFPENSAEQS